jgi:hypothetical protein
LIVGDDLVHDAVDGLLAGVSGTGRQHIDRDRGQAHFAGGQRTPLTIPNANNSRVLGVAHAGNRHQDTVFGNAGDERLAQGGVVANVVADVEQARVEMFQRADRLAGAVVGNLGGGGGVGHDEPF